MAPQHPVQPVSPPYLVGMFRMMSATGVGLGPEARSLVPARAALSWRYLAISIALVVATSFAGSSATQPALPVWYANLAKPWFTPPNLAFPIAWTLLFALMAYGFWRVLRSRPEDAARRRAIVLFVAQLAVNAGWSIAFFGMRSIAAGLVVVVAMLVAIALTIRAFWTVDRRAALMLTPYFLWVSYAALLNASFFILNGP